MEINHSVAGRGAGAIRIQELSQGPVAFHRSQRDRKPEYVTCSLLMRLSRIRTALSVRARMCAMEMIRSSWHEDR